MKDCGVLLHISSLPSPYGIGDLGKEAYEFADFLHDAGQSYWQVLPTVPTSYGDSPYQSPSSFAGNPYFLDLRALCREGLLTEEELQNARMPLGKTDYGKLFETRTALLGKAYSRFSETEEFYEFCKRNAYWLDSYALFSELKRYFSLRPHWEWEKGYDFGSKQTLQFEKEHGHGIKFVKFLQFEFEKQWRALKSYVNSLGIKIIGDAPIYAAYDSADFWENPKRFTVDSCGKVTEVAGVPPDYFSEDGQLWGNPLYNWNELAACGYDYWVNRVRRSFELYDVLRIDHFRGFCAYYAIPAGSATAREGVWRQGPGKALFDAIENALGKTDILAEDLGVDSLELRELLQDCGYPGMKVVQFGFGGSAKQNAHAVGNYSENYFGYTGTHDNDTTLGWYSSLSAAERKKVRARLPKNCPDVSKAVICALFGSKVKTAVVPMQDWLREGSESRMNIPGTKEGNWQYRLKKMPSASLCGEMLETAKKFERSAL